LARFEQDPLVEILNLWSPITAENQALMLTLDPMQKLVNQAKLSDGLEEVNIQVVNEIGVDFNLIIEHEHTHCLL
jgi:transcriptional accessory protein Tex/SPT6